jgi:hypothetical protein
MGPAGWVRLFITGGTMRKSLLLLSAGLLLAAAPSVVSAQNSGSFVRDGLGQIVVPFQSVAKSAEPAKPAKAKKTKKSKKAKKAKKSNKAKKKG